MPSDYTITDLAKLTDVSTRTVRYYIAQGLLPAPTQQGPNARYSELHLDRLRLIKRLQSAHLPLAEIRRRLESLRPDEVATLAEGAASEGSPSDSALDYIQSILQPKETPRVASPMPSASMPIPATTMARRVDIQQPAAPAEPQPSLMVSELEPAQPDRAQWERITLDPNVEIHIRRPLTRQQNRRVERLIAIARELMKED